MNSCLQTFLNFTFLSVFNFFFKPAASYKFTWHPAARTDPDMITSDIQHFSIIRTFDNKSFYFMIAVVVVLLAVAQQRSWKGRGQSSRRRVPVGSSLSVGRTWQIVYEILVKFAGPLGEASGSRVNWGSSRGVWGVLKLSFKWFNDFLSSMCEEEVLKTLSGVSEKDQGIMENLMRSWWSLRCCEVYESWRGPGKHSRCHWGGCKIWWMSRGAALSWPP